MNFSTLEKLPAELMHMVIAPLNPADKMALKMTSKALAKFVPESLLDMVVSRPGLLVECVEMSDDSITKLIIRESRNEVSAILMNIEAQYRDRTRWTVLLSSNCHHHKPRSNFPDKYRSNTAKIIRGDDPSYMSTDFTYEPRRRRVCLPCGTTNHIATFSRRVTVKVDKIDCVVCKCCFKVVPWYTNRYGPFPNGDWVWVSAARHGIFRKPMEKIFCLDCAPKLEAAKKVFHKTFWAIRKSANKEAGN